MRFCRFYVYSFLTYQTISVLRDVLWTQCGDAQAGQILKCSSKMDFQARFMFVRTELEIK